MTDANHDQDYDDGRSQFTMRREGRYAVITFGGESTIEGTRAFTAWVDQQAELVAPDRLMVQMDIRQLSSVGFRVKLAMGKWILRARGYIGGVAVVGDNPAARALAGAIPGVQFFDEPTSARQWLIGDGN